MSIANRRFARHYLEMLIEMPATMTLPMVAWARARMLIEHPGGGNAMHKTPAVAGSWGR